MTQPANVVQMFDRETGQVHEPADMADLRAENDRLAELLADKDVTLERMGKDLRRMRDRVRELEGEFADSAAKRPGAPEIRDILLYCHEVTGRTRAKVVPDSPGWKKVEKMRQYFDVRELKAVPHGAIKTPWFKAASWRLAPKELYRDSDRVQELSDLGLDIVHRTLANGLSLPSQVERMLAGLRPSEFDAFDRCDCGKLRFQHPTRTCREFDDIDRRADEWIVERMADLRRGRKLSEIAVASVSREREMELFRLGLEADQPAPPGGNL